jgi:hypothetical protein
MAEPIALRNDLLPKLPGVGLLSGMQGSKTGLDGRADDGNVQGKMEFLRDQNNMEIRRRLSMVLMQCGERPWAS